MAFEARGSRYGSFERCCQRLFLMVRARPANLSEEPVTVVAPAPGPLGARPRHRREHISRGRGGGGSTSFCCVFLRMFSRPELTVPSHPQ
ncbi:hypothetical protein CROQUDRAFT_152025 [Cronartium quercuum f. sp. fusiforme G11]|uniref:Uncharacterized protein n=1 Tax=Cronartium quercuum f. sp. fusiforme G11 TaxID=708437 RepID=A0A9P6TG70_9BASI|nr:hypothetical protein CROQUDRAFT_152025 [Cronartium quercuum f. sp. fusiforme G11]